MAVGEADMMGAVEAAGTAEAAPAMRLAVVEVVVATTTVVAAVLEMPAYDVVSRRSCPKRFLLKYLCM